MGRSPAVRRQRRHAAAKSVRGLVNSDRGGRRSRRGGGGGRGVPGAAGGRRRQVRRTTPRSVTEMARILAKLPCQSQQEATQTFSIVSGNPSQSLRQR